MDKLKLKWRVFYFMIIFCSSLLLVLWVFQTVFLRQTYRFIRLHEIKEAIKIVGENINNDDDLANVLKKLLIDKEIVVAKTKEFVAPRHLEKTEQDRNKAKPQRIESITETKVFILNDKTEISLTFYAIITPVDATISTLKYQLYIITLIMIIFSVVIAIYMSSKISKPIEQINASAKILSSGNYNTLFNATGFLEIKELSDTLNKTATELSKVENLRRELLANVSHDLRTPLALIYAYTEMMYDFPDEITKDQIQMIMDETKRLTTLVNDVLDISQFENGTMKLKKKNYNLTISIQNLINRISELVTHDGYNIKFIFTDDINIFADEVKITQVIYNLIINAVNFSTKDKTITVKQIILDNKIRIEILDKGEGISKKELDVIWDRYYKSGKKHKRAITGTGLGLSIVKKIIDLHDGNCGVVSDIGEGSVFWFELNITNIYNK